MLPANLFIYGVNDLCDWETDRLNEKKNGYEAALNPSDKNSVQRWILKFTSPWILLLPWLPVIALVPLAGFLLLGGFYSAPPIRAKAIPFLDMIFNGLYIMPGLLGFALMTNTLPPVSIIIAGWLWSMAMHAYSAVPDIQADTAAGIHTTATTLGARATIILCLILYATSAWLVTPWLGPWAGAGATVYAVLMILSLSAADKPNTLMNIYAAFPVINTLVGMGLFFLIIL